MAAGVASSSVQQVLGAQAFNGGAGHRQQGNGRRDKFKMTVIKFYT